MSEKVVTRARIADGVVKATRTAVKKADRALKGPAKPRKPSAADEVALLLATLTEEEVEFLDRIHTVGAVKEVTGTFIDPNGFHRGVTAHSGMWAGPLAPEFYAENVTGRTKVVEGIPAMIADVKRPARVINRVAMQGDRIVGTSSAAMVMKATTIERDAIDWPLASPHLGAMQRIYYLRRKTAQIAARKAACEAFWPEYPKGLPNAPLSILPPWMAGEAERRMTRMDTAEAKELARHKRATLGQGLGAGKYQPFVPTYSETEMVKNHKGILVPKLVRVTAQEVEVETVTEEGEVEKELVLADETLTFKVPTYETRMRVYDASNEKGAQDLSAMAVESYTTTGPERLARLKNPRGAEPKDGDFGKMRVRGGHDVQAIRYRFDRLGNSR